MQQTPPPLWFSGEVPPAAMAHDSGVAVGRGAGRRSRAPLTLVGVLAAGAVVVGILLGGRVSAEDGLIAARDALASGDAGRAVRLDESIAGRSGFLMIFDPGAAGSAARDAQLARVAWARQLASGGDVDGALAVLAQVALPSVAGQAAMVRTQLLLGAATAAVRSGDPSLALQRLDQASVEAPPTSMMAQIASARAADEVLAAAQLLAAGRAVDALALLDDATAHGAGTATAQVLGPTLLAAARQQLAAFEYGAAVVTLNRLVVSDPASASARTARSLLHTPQPVSGTLVDSAGHAVSGRVRIASHYTVVSGGYSTSGPFYYGTADAAGDFTIPALPVGGPFVLEYFRGGSWMTLVDPRTDLPSDPVNVAPATPLDLVFIVLPN